MKRYIKANKKGIIIAFIGLIILGAMVLLKNNETKVELQVAVVRKETTVKINAPEPEAKRVITKEDILEEFFNENRSLTEFLALTFKIDHDAFIDNLKNNPSLDLQNQENLGAYLIDYLFKLEKSNKSLFNNKITPCNDSKEYMLAVIKYFTKIYPSVDFKTAAAIGKIESNYEASTMLKRNNIFGGMSNGGLIKYKSIEYGLLKYVKLLNDGYYEKGLTTVEEIGRVYNPRIDESGKKIASPSWVVNVTNARAEFENYPDVDINYINSLKNNG